MYILGFSSSLLMIMSKTVRTSDYSNAAVEAQPRIDPELKYKGVRKRKWGKYVSEIRLPNSRNRIWLGSYDTAEKAGRAFDAALFCLRGPNAKFNFPDDPPDISGGQRLKPAEIQAVAQQYGNSYGGRGGPRPGRAGELLEDASPSSNSEGAGPIDWSFLDVLDSNSGHVSDFELFHEPGDMCMPPHFVYSHEDDDEDDDGDRHGNGGNVQSLLWNF